MKIVYLKPSLNVPDPSRKNCDVEPGLNLAES